MAVVGHLQLLTLTLITLSVIAGRRTSQLSAQYLTACARSTALVINGNGCCGGYYLAGFNFFLQYGAVTDTCAPYTLYDYSTENVANLLLALGLRDSLVLC